MTQQTATAAPPQLQTLELEPREVQPLAILQPAAEPTNKVVTPADLVRIAMESGDKDIERMERLMAMDERYRQAQERERERQAELAFRRDFAAFRGENIIVPLTKDVDRGRAGSFTQAEYHVAAQMLSPALSKHGFSFRHDQKFGSRRWMTEGKESDIPWVWVTCYLEHREGHVEKVELEGPEGDLSANTPTQNMQATASYLKRQSLLAITGTATGGEDDEGRMRRKTSSAGQEGPDETLQQQGRDASMRGMAALTAWWGALSPKDRSAMNREFGQLRRAAQQADQRGAQ